MKAINLEEKVKTRSKRKYPCKRSKGEHDFSILHLVYPPSKHTVVGNLTPIFSEPFYIYKCSICGKKLSTDKVLKTTSQSKDWDKYLE